MPEIRVLVVPVGNNPVRDDIRLAAERVAIRVNARLHEKCLTTSPYAQPDTQIPARRRATAILGISPTTRQHVWCRRPAGGPESTALAVRACTCVAASLRRPSKRSRSGRRGVRNAIVACRLNPWVVRLKGFADVFANPPPMPNRRRRAGSVSLDDVSVDCAPARHMGTAAVQARKLRKRAAGRGVANAASRASLCMGGEDGGTGGQVVGGCGVCHSGADDGCFTAMNQHVASMPTCPSFCLHRGLARTHRASPAGAASKRAASRT